MKPNEKLSGYVKVRFSGRAGSTAGLIFPEAKVKGMRVDELSRYFPMTEANKMQRIETSPVFYSFDSAFAYQF